MGKRERGLKRAIQTHNWFVLRPSSKALCDTSSQEQQYYYDCINLIKIVQQIITTPYKSNNELYSYSLYKLGFLRLAATFYNAFYSNNGSISQHTLVNSRKHTLA